MEGHYIIWDSLNSLVDAIFCIFLKWNFSSTCQRRWIGDQTSLITHQQTEDLPLPALTAPSLSQTHVFTILTSSVSLCNKNEVVCLVCIYITMIPVLCFLKSIFMYVTLLHIPKLPQNNYDEMLILIQSTNYILNLKLLFNIYSVKQLSLKTVIQLSIGLVLH